jgi:hypothetical protein
MSGVLPGDDGRQTPIPLVPKPPQRVDRRDREPKPLEALVERHAEREGIDGSGAARRVTVWPLEPRRVDPPVNSGFLPE